MLSVKQNFDQFNFTVNKLGVNNTLFWCLAKSSPLFMVTSPSVWVLLILPWTQLLALGTQLPLLIIRIISPYTFTLAFYLVVGRLYPHYERYGGLVCPWNWPNRKTGLLSSQPNLLTRQSLVGVVLGARLNTWEPCGVSGPQASTVEPLY